MICQYTHTVQPPVLKTDGRLKTDHLGFYKELGGEDFYRFPLTMSDSMNSCCWWRRFLMTRNITAAIWFWLTPKYDNCQLVINNASRKMHKNSFLLHPYVYETNHIIVTCSHKNSNIHEQVGFNKQAGNPWGDSVPEKVMSLSTDHF